MNNYNTQVDNLNNQMLYPTDPQSLYADRIYDEQTAEKRAYESVSPMQRIMDSFKMRDGLTMTNVLKVVLILVIVYLAYTLYMDSKKETISLNIPTVTPTPTNT